MAKVVQSPFVKQQEERIHLKDEYYKQAKEQFVSCIKLLRLHNVNVDEHLIEKIRLDIKSHYKAVEGF